MNRLDEIYSQSKGSADFARNYFAYISEVFSKIDPNEIGRFIELLLEARQERQTVYFIGNGGSAATSSHFANDLAAGTRTKSKHFRVVSLTDNTALLTALANDDGYENIFTRQLDIYLNPNDVVVAISASGNSPNLLKAVELAKSRNCKIVVLTGFDGGKLLSMGDIKIHVPTRKGEYGPVEDLHMIVDHLVGSFLCREVKKLETEERS